MSNLTVDNFLITNLAPPIWDKYIKYSNKLRLGKACKREGLILSSCGGIQPSAASKGPFGSKGVFYGQSKTKLELDPQFSS